MTTFRVNNSTLLGGEICAPWQLNHAYALGARCVCRVAYATAAARAFVYEVTTAGTSHAVTEPTWPLVVGNTVVDNGVTWTCRNPNDGSWDNASCFLHYILNHASPAAGDWIYMDDGHAETTFSTAYTVKGSTTFNGMIHIFCVDKATDLISVGAVVQPASGNSISFTGFGFSYGVKYKSNNSNIGFYGSTAASYWILEGAGATVLIEINGAAAYLRIGNASYLYLHRLDIRSGSIAFDATTEYIWLNYGGWLNWFKGIVSTGGSGVAKLFDSANGGRAVVADVDLDDVGMGATAATLVDAADTYLLDLLFERCKLPTDAGFVPIGGTWGRCGEGKVRLHHCSGANNVHDFHEEGYEGSIVDETSIYRDNGAYDGVTHQSWKMVSSANVLDGVNGVNPLESPPIHTWTESVEAKTFQIEGVLDSATNLQDDEIWMEVEYPKDALSGIGEVSSDKVTLKGTPADHDASTEAWSGTGGMGNVNKFKLAVTITPGKKGPVTARVFLAKPSATVYVDPMMTEV